MGQSDYLYFRKIVPALNAAPSILPSTQFKHAKMHLTMLQERGERPWYLFYLKHLKAITAVIVLLMIPGFLKAFELI